MMRQPLRHINILQSLKQQAHIRSEYPRASLQHTRGPRHRSYATNQSSQSTTSSTTASVPKSASSPATHTNSSSTITSKTDRLSRFQSRLPKFLQPTLNALRAAPVTHITAFLLLHELTAVIPLFGLAGAFHYYNWLPPYVTEGAWVVAGVEKFGRYFRRKGWIDSQEEQEVEQEAKELQQHSQEHGPIEKGKRREFATRWWSRGEGATRWIIEFATAYAVVKAFMPLRIVVSVWAAPWFARWSVIPMTNAFKRVFRKSRPGMG